MWSLQCTVVDWVAREHVARRSQAEAFFPNREALHKQVVAGHFQVGGSDEGLRFVKDGLLASGHSREEARNVWLWKKSDL